MSEKRVIKVNPELFNISNTTRKQKPKKEKDIKIKNSKKENNKSIKRKLLNFIRDKQNEKIKEKVKSNPQVPNDFKSEFDTSLEYFNSLAEKVPSTNNNTTIKNYKTHIKPSSISNGIENKEVSNLNTYERSNVKIPESPKYGCLKNGKLPTYRSWINQTQKNKPAIENKPALPNVPVQSSYIQESDKTKLENASIISEYKQAQKLNNNNYVTPKLRKKTTRRNFTVGRSKKTPKISVLVSNKEMRKNITMKKSILQQDDIHSIKKFLIKRGLIKVGSIAPNNVLREMYENASLMCGDIKNHNPDNLVYNYFNYNEE
tara:strand:- start:443 stop:1393 length:951 start_codon:yes stop_codon:yes gene_type:complete